MSADELPAPSELGPAEIRELIATPEQRELFRRVRELCLSLPGGNERLSHGSPTFFIDKQRSFTKYVNNHHGDGRVALWCPCPAETRQILLDTKPDVYFIPPYVGPSGWVGIRLDRDAEWQEISDVVVDGYLLQAPLKYRQAVLERFR